MAIHSEKTKSIIRAGVQSRNPFSVNGTLRGELSRPTGITTGQLPLWADRILRDQADESGGAFVVYSYGTPIAWHTTAHGWVIPSCRYSNTTTNHQSQVRMAAGTYDDPSDS